MWSLMNRLPMSNALLLISITPRKNKNLNKSTCVVWIAIALDCQHRNKDNTKVQVSLYNNAQNIKINVEH